MAEHNAVVHYENVDAMGIPLNPTLKVKSEWSHGPKGCTDGKKSPSVSYYERRGRPHSPTSAPPFPVLLLVPRARWTQAHRGQVTPRVSPETLILKVCHPMCGVHDPKVFKHLCHSGDLNLALHHDVEENKHF